MVDGREPPARCGSPLPCLQCLRLTCALQKPVAPAAFTLRKSEKKLRVRFNSAW